MSQVKNFSKQIEATYENDGAKIEVHKIEYQDSTILSIRLNGALDSTYKLLPPKKASFNVMAQSENSGIPNIDPIMLVGDHNNMKAEVVVSQIGNLVFQISEPKPLIVSIGTRWFGRGDSVQDNDFEKLIFVLDNIKRLYSS